MQKSASILTNKTETQTGPKVHFQSHYQDSKGHSAHKFTQDARRMILDIQQRGKIPILEGGATFYI